MILMPETLTAENGAKAALIGEFHETFIHECSECEGCGLGPASPHTQAETRCELCNGTGELVERIPVEWTTIKEIYKRAVALLGQSQSDAIAEAVAAEREKNLVAVESARISTDGWGDPIDDGDANETKALTLLCQPSGAPRNDPDRTEQRSSDAGRTGRAIN